MKSDSGDSGNSVCVRAREGETGMGGGAGSVGVRERKRISDCSWRLNEEEGMDSAVQ